MIETQIYPPDFAFIFQYPTGENRQLALWTHQCLLAYADGQFGYIVGLPNVYDKEHGAHKTGIAPNPNRPPFSISTIQVPEFSLVAHCVMIRYLISGKLVRNTDLEGYLITNMPMESPQLPLNRSGAVGELLEDPLKTASWAEMDMLAKRYGLKELEKLCAEHV